jgi:hypothetical protein
MSSAGTLTASAGRTLAAMTRSTNQTSPVAGISFRLLVTIELDKQAVGSRNDVVVVRQIVGSQGHATYQLRNNLRPIAIGKRVEFVEQLLGTFGHEIRFAFGVLGGKLVREREAYQLSQAYR